jgi:hypothetical protein
VKRNHPVALCGILACLALAPAVADGEKPDRPDRDGLSAPVVEPAARGLAAGTDQPLGPEAPELDLSRTFYRGELLPRLTYRLERHRDRVRPLVAPGEEWLEHLVWEQTSADVRRDVERATRKAVRDHLLENTRLSNVIASIERRARGDRAGAAQGVDAGAPARGGRGDRLEFDLGFHSAIPEVEVQYRLERSDVRLDLSLSGSVGVRYRHVALGSTEVHAGYDNDDDSYRLLASFGF